MAFLKPLLTLVLALFALVAGLFAALLVAFTAIGVFVTRRIFRRSAPVPPRGPATRAAPRTRPTEHGDAIDVVATEIPSERLP